MKRKKDLFLVTLSGFEVKRKLKNEDLGTKFKESRLVQESKYDLMKICFRDSLLQLAVWL